MSLLALMVLFINFLQIQSFTIVAFSEIDTKFKGQLSFTMRKIILCFYFQLILKMIFLVSCLFYNFCGNFSISIYKFTDVSQIFNFIVSISTEQFSLAI